MAKEPKTIPGKGRVPGWDDTDLTIEVFDDDYEAYDKQLPEDLPATTENGESIKWFNNFGVRPANGPQERTVPEYRVILRELPDIPAEIGKPAGGSRKRRLCVFYDGRVHEIQPTSAGPDRPGRVMFSSRMEQLPWFSNATWTWSESILTYLRITSTNSCCSAGR